MSRADSLWTSRGEPVLMYWFAKSITYRDDRQPATVAISEAMVTRESQERRENQIGGWDVVTTRTARFSTISTPLRLDGIVTIDGADYSIESMPKLENGRTQLNLVRTEIGEITRAGYRQQ